MAASNKFNVYVETAPKRTFAGALDWPGWCRSGGDEASALAALIEYAPRYARIIRPAKLGFEPPADVRSLKVTQRHKGGATTDFGAPEVVLDDDAQPITSQELERFEAIFRAGWQAFDRAVKAATGKTLSKGPRGGGRALKKMIQHVNESDLGYLGAIGWKVKFNRDRQAGSGPTREAILEALRAVAPLGQPEPGPRGGKRWPARYFIRRTIWHLLDHAWEIEDRAK